MSVTENIDGCSNPSIEEDYMRTLDNGAINPFEEAENGLGPTVEDKDDIQEQ